MRSLILLSCATGLSLTSANVAAAQSSARWKEIGRTSSGNVVSYDTRSVKTKNGITSVTLQVKFTTPTDVKPGVKWYLSRHDAMFDCAKHAVASKENRYYGDAAATKVVQRDVIKIPGFGPAIDGSMAQVAMDHFCKK